MRKLIPAAVVAATLVAAPSAYAAASPTVKPRAVTAIGQTAATLHGTVNPNGLATSYQFEYGPTSALGKGAPLTAGSAGAGTLPVAEATRITGLSPDTTYYYELVATNNDGTSTTPVETFKTTGNPAPNSTTDFAASVGRNFATLVGTIAPNNQATSYYFQYGLTASYGLQTAPSTIPAGNAPTTVTALLAGLAPGTVFHYRLVASHGITSTTYGNDVTFQTLPWPRRHTALSFAVASHMAGRTRVSVTTRGRIGLPAATLPSVGCSGAVSIRYYLGARRLGMSRAFVGPRCGYSAAARIPDDYGRLRLTVRVSYGGDIDQAPVNRSRVVTVG